MAPFLQALCSAPFHAATFRDFALDGTINNIIPTFHRKVYSIVILHIFKTSYQISISRHHMKRLMKRLVDFSCIREDSRATLLHALMGRPTPHIDVVFCAPSGKVIADRYITIPTFGDWTFCVISDDGSRLLLNGNTVCCCTFGACEPFWIGIRFCYDLTRNS